MHEIEGIWIKYVKVDYDLSDGLKNATVSTFVTLENISHEDLSDNITLSIDDKEYLSLSVNVKKQETKTFDPEKIILSSFLL